MPNPGENGYLARLDADQVLRAAWDENSKRLRTDAQITGTIEVHLDAANDNVAISDGTDTLEINPDGSINTQIEGEVEIEISAADGDNIAISDGTHTLDVNPDGSINAVVTATNLDTRPLDATTDNVAISDGVDTLEINADGSINIAGSVTIPGTVAVTQSTTPWVENVSQFGGNNVVTGTGASGAGIPRVTVSNDSNILATQSGTWNINDVTGTVSLPTGASTSANQTNNLQRTQIVNAIGNSAAVQTLGTTPTSSDFGILTNSLLYGLTTGGGGGYIPVKVNPSGTLTADVTGTVTANQGTSPWVVGDGGGSLTVDNAGTFAVQAAQSGAWSVAVNNGAGAAAVNIQDGGNSITVDGTVTVTQATASNLNAQVVGSVANAATDSGNPVKTGGVVNTTAPTYTDGQRANLQQDTRGSVFVNNEGRRRTYSAASLGLTVAATPTDIFTITGAANTIVRITAIRFSAESTANAVNDVVLLKRSTANTGGTSAAVTAIPHDSADAAASATVLQYTANPTTGTLVGNIRTCKFLSSGASTQTPQIIDFSFAAGAAKPVLLRSTSEVLAINLAATTIAGSTLDIYVEWTEEAI